MYERVIGNPACTQLFFRKSVWKNLSRIEYPVQRQRMTHGRWIPLVPQVGEMPVHTGHTYSWTELRLIQIATGNQGNKI